MPYTEISWSEARERLKDRFEGVPFWSAGEARSAFNEALRFFNLLAGRWHGTEVLLTVANQYRYTLPTAIFALRRVEFVVAPAIPVEGIPLSPSSLEDLTNARPNWRTETTASGGDVPTVPTVFAPLDLFSFYIWPADAGAGDTLQVEGVATTPILVEEDDRIDLGEELLNALYGYALHVLAFKKGGPAFQSTTPALQQLLAVAAEENDQIKSSQIYRRLMGLPMRDLRPMQGAGSLLDPIARPA